MSTGSRASALQSSTQPIRVGVVGLGRMGKIHALHIHELEHESDLCRLTCISATDQKSADAFHSLSGTSTPFFDDIESLAQSGLCDVAIIATNTPLHREHALMMIRVGHRVFLEKPLTGTLDGDREFAALLDGEHPQSLMLGFQRRFDAPLLYAKQLIDQGAIGRIFKIYSALEDSSPAPDGFARHDQTGYHPYGYQARTCQEDFDDALMLLDFGDELIGQLQVTRNHVSGYRGETLIFGEKGQIHIGRFNQKLLEVIVEAYGTRESKQPIACKTFSMRRYEQPLPEFIDRFGEAYKEELKTFLECCRRALPFPITHRDGLLAQEIVAGAMRGSIKKEDMATIDYLELRG